MDIVYSIRRYSQDKIFNALEQDMVNLSPYDVMLERIYPLHLHITPDDESTKNDKCSALLTHFENDNIDKIIVELANQIGTFFPGKSNDQALKLFHKELFKIAEDFVRSDSFIVSTISLSLITQIICNDDSVVNNTEIFALYQERFEAKMIEYNRALNPEDWEEPESVEEEEALYKKTCDASNDWQAFMYECVSYCARAASVVSGGVRRADEIHQIAIEMLTYVGAKDIPTYDKIVFGNSDICLCPEDYPSGEKIIRQSYRCLIKESEDRLTEAEEEGGKESAHMYASNFLWLHAGTMITFHSIPSLKGLAVAGFCQHRDYIEELGAKKVDVEFTKIRKHFQTYASKPQYVGPLEELMKLMFRPPVPVMWIAPSRPSGGDQKAMAIILKCFNKLKSNPHAYRC